MRGIRQKATDTAFFLGEYATVKLGGDRRPTGWRRWMFRFPIALYRWGLDGLIAKRILLLRTIGRNTGRVHVTPLEYLHDDDTFYLMAGWHGRTDWVRNIENDPDVRIRVGRRELRRRAHVLGAVESALVVQRWIAQTPTVARILQHDTGIPYRGTLISATEIAANYTVVALPAA